MRPSGRELAASRMHVVGGGPYGRGEGGNRKSFFPNAYYIVNSSSDGSNKVECQVGIGTFHY